MSTTIFTPARCYSGSNFTISNGGLTVARTTTSWVNAFANFGLYQSGKGYFEFKANPATGYYMGGVCKLLQDTLNSTDQTFSDSPFGWSFRAETGTNNHKENNGTTTLISGATMTANDVMGVAVDAGAGKIWWAKNNTWLEGDPATGATPSFSNGVGRFSTVFPALSVYGSNMTVNAYFASASLTYTPPSGFSAWNDVATVELNNVTGRWDGLLLQSDIEDGGAYRIQGNVTELGIPGPYRVRLFDRKSARCIRETWSDTNGDYLFNYIDYRLNGYFVVAYDHGDNPLNAAIADFVTPELMT